MKQEMIAMILAGGRGSRLGKLTKRIAKPVVYFGGKYRIIDYVLSNCANSSINTVGILTQYESTFLNEYVGDGQKWGLDANGCACVLLPPHQKEEEMNWYSGTASAIYQNLDFIDKYESEYVIILSADHIYKMDYTKMLDFHKQKGADCTISAINVSYEEAKRFGILNVNKDYSIWEFEEKPKKPKSTLASMGVYIFNYKVLKNLLTETCSKEKDKEHDFGKHILPKMLSSNYKMFAYPYEGYWKDVGTIESLWQANMDLLENNEEISSQEWKIFSKDTFSKPQFIGKDALVKNSIINQGCIIEGTVEDSVIFNDVHVGKNAKVISSVILPNVSIGENAIIYKSIINENYKINENEVINEESKEVLLLSK